MRALAHAAPPVLKIARRAVENTVVPSNATSIGLSGLTAAMARLNSSAHNIANVLTEDFRPLRTTQAERAEGGVDAHTEQLTEPRAVDLAQEFVEQIRAQVAARASLRAIDTSLDVLGFLLDETA